MTGHIWDQVPDSPGGNYAKWETPGTIVTGVIRAVTLGKSMEGVPVPQLDVETSTGIVTISASQADLKNRLKRSGAIVGQTITVVYTGDMQIGGGKTMKTFTVANVDASTAPTVGTDDDIF